MTKRTDTLVGLLMGDTLAPGKRAELVRLANAAPDLLAALKEALRVLATPGGFPDKGKGRTEEQQRAFDAARNALAKARG